MDKPKEVDKPQSDCFIKKRKITNNKSKFLPNILGNWLCSSSGELLFIVLGYSSVGASGNKFAKRKMNGKQ